MGIEKITHGKQNTGVYRREMKRTWWTETPFYRLYMLREATAVFTLLYSMNLIFGLSALSDGKLAFLSWVALQKQPLMLVFAVLSFLMVGYHCYTWFNATPKVMPLQIGAKKVPPKQIVLGHWVAAIGLAVIVLVVVGL